MIYRPRRFVAAVASSTLALLDPGAGCRRRNARTGRRDRHARRESLGTRYGRSGRRRLRRATVECRRCRGQPGAGGFAAFVQFPATGTCRRHRYRSVPRRCAVSRPIRRWCWSTASDAMRPHSSMPMARSAAAPPPWTSTRFLPACAPVDRSAARRRVGPVRLRCNRRRAQPSLARSCTKAATRRSATAGASRATTRRPPRPTIVSPAPC